MRDLYYHLKKKLKTEESRPQINVYTSHTPDKFSFHIVVQNRIADNNIECKRQVVAALEGFEHDLCRYIDLTLYKRNQLFRLLGSSKIDKDNRKIWYCGSKEFQDSLVTVFE